MNNNSDLKILFACSEMTPWIKTGGLADVCGSLPQALQQAGVDIRIVLPGYHKLLQEIPTPRFVAMLELPLGTVTICCSELDGIEVLLVNHELFTNRPGNPYMSDTDRPWPDNALRFAIFSQAICEIANSPQNLSPQNLSSQNLSSQNAPSKSTEWRPDIVHCHDWQTGLVPALLSLTPEPPATVFTIHNLAYQGNITMSEYNRLNLPDELLITDGLEFWGQASFIKGGIAYADKINTVSPTYAEEITGKEFGCGMEGLLLHRRGDLSGILNGIDTQAWNPAIDAHIQENYDIDTIAVKAANKLDLQQHLGLTPDPEVVLFGVISRLAVQKGIDVIIDTIKSQPSLKYQLAVLGSGDSSLQKQLLALAQAHPTQIAVELGFNEALSHKIEAGADAFLMPSRYEPCGLNQMYSHRYGTLPLITRVGGLADTVIDPKTNPDTANGFVIDAADVKALHQGMQLVIDTFSEKQQWLSMQRNAMSADYSWSESASHYLNLYRAIVPPS